jgi:hypothetical protein
MKIMFIRRLLFETKLGELFLMFLEQKVGLAVVQADWLAVQRSAAPEAVREAR